MVNAGRVAVVPKGEFSLGTQYTRLDLVTYNDSAYIAKKNNVGVLPTDTNTWMLVVSSVGGNIGDIVVTFNEAAQRANIVSGEKINTIFGKIKKVITDLKNVAFTGAYGDLTGRPDSLKNPQALTFTGGVTGSYDGSAAKSVAIPTSLPANGGTSASCSGNAATATTASKTAQSLTFTGNVTGTWNGSAAKTVNIPDLLDSIEQVSANTNSGHGVDALVVKELNDSLVNADLSDSGIKNTSYGTYRKRNGIVEISLNYPQASIGTSYINLFTLPQGFRPISNGYYIGASASAVIVIYIATTGEVSVKALNSTSVSGMYANITFIAA